ncbi:hypothetical protein Pen02_75860 [Plantactinospora endophytica]|uniref:DUF2029 domain-containing protein n=1 Tax=Plantactinospora endophytica TaxID=673535 RepID=A0ABQ4ED43_9ACTN|nr:hypothetical protein Pen02_75860 [Plantactinospora endophytica]
MGLIVGLAGAIALAIALLPGHRGWFDIGVYHGAVNHWLHDRGPLYDYVRPGTDYGFTYPPFAALCMLPMAWLGWYPTIALNVALTALAAALVLWLLVDPIARREGWRRGFGFALAACLFAMLGPVRDTVSFGQVNLVLLALVYADVWLLGRGHRLAGIGSGLAAAIKLTPAIFIGYLLVTRRWRAAATATATVATATLLAWLVAPEASREYFGRALWDTGRVGALDYVSNQSLLGAVARWNPEHPDRLVWIVLVGVVLVVWAHRARQAVRCGDDRAGFALTGVAACLVSPVTWVHHLVWLVPALVVLADSALLDRPAGTASRRPATGSASPAGGLTSSDDALVSEASVPGFSGDVPASEVSGPAHRGGRAGRRRWGWWIIAYLLLCGSVVWLWATDHSGIVGFLGSNGYVLLALAMLGFLPTGRRAATDRPAAIASSGRLDRGGAVVG